MSPFIQLIVLLYVVGIPIGLFFGAAKLWQKWVGSRAKVPARADKN